MSELFQEKSEPVSTGRDPGPPPAQPAHFTDMETEAQTRRLTCPRSRSELRADLGLEQRGLSRVSHKPSLALLSSFCTCGCGSPSVIITSTFQMESVSHTCESHIRQVLSVNVFLFHTISSKLASA